MELTTLTTKASYYGNEICEDDVSTPRGPAPQWCWGQTWQGPENEQPPLHSRASVQDFTDAPKEEEDACPTPRGAVAWHSPNFAPPRANYEPQTVLAKNAGMTQDRGRPSEADWQAQSTSWMRMRTPSPEATYSMLTGRATPPPRVRVGGMVELPVPRARPADVPPQPVVENMCEAVCQTIKPARTWSQGSCGHPADCGPACKYVRKSRGCKDGEHCTFCHLCEWNRYGKASKMVKQ
mmetsp:Transcript_21955/g.50182  ORF Transcript_21955/g.50182 Transcript_21955/m.50182 type:complete len:237 (+) Transcript_21955:89-799(+)